MLAKSVNFNAAFVLYSASSSTRPAVDAEGAAAEAEPAPASWSGSDRRRRFANATMAFTAKNVFDKWLLIGMKSVFLQSFKKGDGRYFRECATSTGNACNCTSLEFWHKNMKRCFLGGSKPLLLSLPLFLELWSWAYPRRLTSNKRNVSKMHKL